MPSASVYRPDNADWLKDAEDERGERAKCYIDAAMRYDGEWSKRDGQMGYPRPLKAGKTDNNVLINLQRTATDNTMSFAAPEFPVLQLSEDAETPQEQTLRDWWEAQGGNVWLHNAMLAGIQSGHVFIRMIPPQATEAPRAVLLNPANIIATYSADDCEEALWYSLYYTLGGKQHRLDFVKLAAMDAPETDEMDLNQPADPVGWKLIDYVKKTDNLIGWMETKQEDWPYAMAPIIDWQHLPRPFRYYGQDEMQGKHINDAVNKVASDIKAILRIHAAPRVVITGASKGKLEVDGSVDSLWYLPSEGSKVNILEMQGDLGSSLNYLTMLRDVFFELQRVTEVGGGPDAFKNMTNLSVKAVFMKQIAKTRTIRHQYAKGLQMISQAAMEMLNIAIEPPKVEWTDDLPESETEMTTAIQKQIDMGVMSKKTASGALGLKYDEEQKQIESESGTMSDLQAQIGQLFARVPQQLQPTNQQGGAING